MSIDEIIEELSKLPKLLYHYYPNDVEHHSCFIILGGHSGQLVDRMPEGIRLYEKRLLDMISIYEKNTMDEEDKYSFVDSYSFINSNCGYSIRAINKINEQRQYLEQLDIEQLSDISEQIEMYKLARSMYKDYHN